MSLFPHFALLDLPQALNAAAHRPHIGKSLFVIFFRPPDRGGFLRSSAVKKNFSVFGETCLKALKFSERKRSRKPVFPPFFLVIVGADQEGVSRRNLTIRFVGFNSTSQHDFAPFLGFANMVSGVMIALKGPARRPAAWSDRVITFIGAPLMKKSMCRGNPLLPRRIDRAEINPRADRKFSRV
jgi:hypothetical protein